eukprot:TRINITY_DN27_c0_g1_i1.p1 TRINITY_DN27_c0_g1~~TRINITY_DN27_c0_g1_i1.p1  ORF type:complete len:782 (-),score=291.69 TRINITY_DN27_c0_g1_i1:1007-3352(-)
MCFFSIVSVFSDKVTMSDIEFINTIHSDNEDAEKTAVKSDDEKMDGGFFFHEDTSDEESFDRPEESWTLQNTIDAAKKQESKTMRESHTTQQFIDFKIKENEQKREQAAKEAKERGEIVEDEEESDFEADEEIEEEQEDVSRDISRKKKSTKASKFFADDPFLKKHKAGDEATFSFMDLKLSRPLLRAVNALGFVKPTPIQARAIPVGLEGRDICGSAVTGSGKTAAFLLPVLERLLYRSKRIAATRVAIILPTRELATQVHAMLNQLGKFTDITACLVVGGMSLPHQAIELRNRPDVVVCTPGRMIDHLMNSHSVHFDDIDVLILDEADRLLEMGFTQEVEQLVNYCPETRQSMLFSATMTDKVDDLVKLSLKRPVRISADPLFDMAQRLQMEFVRVKKSQEGDRKAMLLSLVTRSFNSKTIVFFQQKRTCHENAILFGLFGLKFAELHGNLTQTQRLESLEAFRKNEVDYLLATDLAGRGLDIKGVQTVINFEMPNELANYIHRVGRTARAGRKGTSVTLVGETNRIMMKEIVKRATMNVRSRKIPANVVEKWRNSIQSRQKDVVEVMEAERIEKEARQAEMELNKAINMIKHKDEIEGRPAKQWFQTVQAKTEIKRQRLQAMKDRMSQFVAESAPPANTDTLEEVKKSVEKKNNRRNKKEQDKRPHRMSRKKRRRMEMIEEDKQWRAEQGEEDIEKEFIAPKPKRSKKKETTKQVEDVDAPDRNALTRVKGGSRFAVDTAGRERFHQQTSQWKEQTTLLRKGGKRTGFKSKTKFKRKR